MDIKTYFSESYKTDFETVNKQVEHDLNSLIQSEISRERYSDVLVLGRKGVSLFQPHIEKVNGENHLQGIYSIQLSSHSPHALISTLHPRKFSKFLPRKFFEIFRKRTSGNIILLADAIKTGREVSTIIDKTINAEKVKKVCGYLANKEGLVFLQNKYPKIQFSFPKIVDPKNYDNEQDRLQYIYQTRLIPADGDHPYRIYSLKYQIAIEDILAILDSLIKKYKSQEYPEIKKDNLIVPHISSYTFNLNLDLFLQDHTNLQQDLYKIIRSQMRIKFDPNRSQIRIMALALDETESDQNSESSLIKYRQCGLDFENKYCDGIIGPNMEIMAPNKFCPHCIDVNISNKFLDFIEDQLTKDLASKGIKMGRTAL